MREQQAMSSGPRSPPGSLQDRAACSGSGPGCHRFTSALNAKCSSAGLRPSLFKMSEEEAGTALHPVWRAAKAGAT